MLTLMMSICAWADEETLTLATADGIKEITVVKKGTSGSGGDMELTKGDITVTSSAGYFAGSGTNGIQIYKNGTMTVSVPATKKITKIVLTYAGSCYPFEDDADEELTLSTKGQTDGQQDATYTISAPGQSVTFTNNSAGQTKVKKMVVTYVDSGVANVSVTGVSLNWSSLDLLLGQTSTLVATVTPSNATNKNVTWSTSDDQVAKVSAAGVVTAVGKGNATITVKTADGNYTATCNVRVSVVPVSSISLNKTSLELKATQTAQLTATVLPEAAADKSVVWTSSDDDIATVVDGLVTAVAEGSATITVTTVDGGFKATCDVDVIPNFASAENTIVFAANTSNSDSGASWSTSSDVTSVFSSGAEYVESITAVDKVYPARNSLVNGVKFGTSSVKGTITLKLKEAIPATKIVVSAAPYGDTEGQDGFTINGKSVSMAAGLNKKYADYEVTLDGSDLSTITLTQNTADKGRIYVQSITIVNENAEKQFFGKSMNLIAQNENGYYATFSSDKATFFPDDYVVSAVGVENGKIYTFANDEAFDEDIVEIDGEEVIGYYVPANTGVLVYSVDPEVTYYKAYNVTPSTDVEAINMLCPASKTMEGDFKFYKLAYNDYSAKTGLGFYYGAADGAAFTCKAGTAYLAVPATAASAKGYAFDGTTTAISNVATQNTANSVAYNLAGQRVNANQKGIVIVNGMKRINK